MKTKKCTNFHYTYRLTDPNTNEFYIGVRSCKCAIKKDSYMGSMKAWKVDKSTLVKEIIGTYETRVEANKAESEIITLYIDNPLNRNYHIPPFTFHNYGRKLSDEHRKKLSEAHKGKKLSDEHKKKLSDAKKGNKAWNKGKKASDEHRKKISEALKGKKRSPRTEETKKKLSDANMGKKHSAETIKKLSEAHKGKKAWNKGKKMSEEARKKLSEARKGMKLSDEHRKKLSEAGKRRWKAKKI